MNKSLLVRIYNEEGTLVREGDLNGLDLIGTLRDLRPGEQITVYEILKLFTVGKDK